MNQYNPQEHLDIVEEKLQTLEELGSTRIINEIQKQIYLTIQKGGALYHIEQQIDEEISREMKEQYNRFRP